MSTRRCCLQCLCWAVAAWAAVPVASASASASVLTLANTYHPGLDLSQYWVSEKYDGIRAHWTGTQLLTRQGMVIDAPSWFTAGWPQQAFDGELWAGRRQFAAVQSAVGQGRSDAAGWRAVRYMVFDLPQHAGNFAQRQQALRAHVNKLRQPWVQAVPQWPIPNHDALMRQLREVSNAGAEGLMLRRTDSPYRGGRSDDLIKLKLFEDAEATVVQHLAGHGKYQGVLGALLVEMPSGQRFKLGTGFSDAERAHPPPIGSSITYRFNGVHPSGLPRFARYWRVRESERQAPDRTSKQ